MQEVKSILKFIQDLNALIIVNQQLLSMLLGQISMTLDMLEDFLQLKSLNPNLCKHYTKQNLQKKKKKSIFFFYKFWIYSAIGCNGLNAIHISKTDRLLAELCIGLNLLERWNN